MNNGISDVYEGNSAYYYGLYANKNIILIGNNSRGNVYLSNDNGRNFANISEGTFL